MLPITLTNLEDTLAVVVGGGAVGERKIRALLAARVRVRLISPQATPPLAEWAHEGVIEWLQRPYQPGDLADAALVFAATDDRAVNHAVATAARRRGLLVNVADRPAEGNFHMPAVHRHEDLIVAVSTQMGRPRRAVAVRDWIAMNWDTDPWVNMNKTT